MTVRELLPTLIESRKVAGTVSYISFAFNKGYEITPETKVEYYDDAVLDAKVLRFTFSETHQALIVKCE